MTTDAHLAGQTAQPDPSATPERLASALNSAGFAATLTSGPVRTMTERLTRRGLTVHTRADEDCWRLKVTRAGTGACVVIVDDDQYLTCEYTARRKRSSPAGIARIVAAMLGTGYTTPQPHAHPHHRAALIGAVGRDMRARGMTVTLDVAEDDETCTVFPGIVITSPARPERGHVTLDNDGWIHWECDAAAIPGGLAHLAGTLADVLMPEGRTARERLAAICGACLRAITATAAADNGNRGHHE